MIASLLCESGDKDWQCNVGRRPSTHDRPSRAGRFLAAQWQEILRALDGFGDFAQKFFQIFVAVDEIDLRGVDDEQVRRCVVKEKCS